MTSLQSGFVDRYEAAGLVCNPFTAPALPAAADFDCEHLFVDRGLSAPPPPRSKALVQVIGESGMGKSSQLRNWMLSRPGPFHYIPRDPYRDRWNSPPRPARSLGTIYGDEIDRMPAPLRWRWFRTLARANATLIIGTHTDLSAVARRCGFEVITHHLAPVDSETFRKIVDRRLSSYATTRRLRLNLDDADLDVIRRESNGVPGLAEVALHQLVAEQVRSCAS